MKRAFCITAILLSTNSVYAKLQTQVIIPPACPEEIQTIQKLKTTPDSYTVIENDAPHFWEKVTFYNGKPSDQASLAPDETTKNKSVWNFSREDAIYLSCGYHQTSMEIFRALPRGLHTCTVTFDADTQVPTPKKIQCE